MARAGPGVQDMPLPGCGLGVRLPHMLGDRRRDDIEMACFKECRAVPQLHRAVAAQSGSSSSTAQKIDVTRAGKVEGMVIAADERAGRGG
jgi:hypothetical protein